MNRFDAERPKYGDGCDTALHSLQEVDKDGRSPQNARTEEGSFLDGSPRTGPVEDLPIEQEEAERGGRDESHGEGESGGVSSEPSFS